MEDKKDIWSSFNFTKNPVPSAYSYLKSQIKYLEEKTNGRLSMEYNYQYTDGSTLVYIVAPSLGGYRRKILEIKKEGGDIEFPVNIYSNISDELFINIKEEDFLKTISNIIKNPLVNNSILSLYQLADENFNR